MDVRAPHADPRSDVASGARGPVCFGPFQLHIAERRIERNGSAVRLGARALDILIALVERAGSVVGKNDLMARAWPGITIDEGSLRVQVAALRKALGDGEGGARYLTAVSGRGYCFVAQLSRPDDPKPAPVGPSLGAHNLPPRLARMVGYDQTIRDILLRLKSGRFLSIVGPGGVGKTMVAVSAGHALLTEFAGQVQFLDLGAIHDGRLVPGVVASALGLLVRPDNPSDSLAAFLRDKRALLILDCCEHVIESVAELAERLHREAPQLRILATSRESLRVEGEHIYRLLPLASPPDEPGLSAAHALTFPAVQLFVERAAACHGQFELNDVNAYAVGDICRRLDGIALAIELAASRVGAYGIKHTVELLNNQFELLSEGRRTALPRHRTLRATIDWSYNLLTAPERDVLCRLSVFFGNFTLEAARSLAAAEDADEATVVAVLADLVAKSMLTLVTSSPSARYRLLDTTRAYALQKLVDSGEFAAASRRHARYFLDLLENLHDKSNDDLAEISDQLGNIRAALTWSFSEQGDSAIGVGLAAAAMPLFIERSLFAECQLWVTRAIERLAATDHSLSSTGSMSHHVAEKMPDWRPDA
jgi:predicted ATPase/DNA-binding winged helix-turn-helix (wHTH) protein